MIKAIKIFLVVLFAIIYIPLNELYLKAQKWQDKLFTQDKVMYYCFLPFYWILIIITTTISIPYEALGESLH